MEEQRRYTKTPRAWEALSWPDLTGPRTHTLLLLANGKRSEQELTILLGNDVKELLQRLQQQGYLQCANDAPAAEDDDVLANA